MKNKGFFLIQEFQRRGKPLFTVPEAQSLLKVSRPSIMATLARLRRDHLIVTITNDLYAILQPTEQPYGLRPLRILDPFMKHLNSDYYVGLLSAANHWGAAHHKPQMLQVLTARRHFLKRLEKLKIRLVLKKHFPEVGIVSAKASFGFYNISSPELTALDVIRYEKICGGFNNICLAVRDLIGEMKEHLLMNCCKNYGTMSSIQRLGYMMENYKAPEKMLTSLKKWKHGCMRKARRQSLRAKGRK